VRSCTTPLRSITLSAGRLRQRLGLLMAGLASLTVWLWLSDLLSGHLRRLPARTCAAQPILRITRTYQVLSSLADLFAISVFRSTLAGTADHAVHADRVLRCWRCSSKPLPTRCRSSPRNPGRTSGGQAGLLWWLITLFAILFGATAYLHREKHEAGDCHLPRVTGQADCYRHGRAVMRLYVYSTGPGAGIG